MLQHMLGIVCFQPRTTPSSGLGFWVACLSDQAEQRGEHKNLSKPSLSSEAKANVSELSFSAHFYVKQNSSVSQHRCKQGRRCLQPSFCKRDLSEEQTLTLITELLSRAEPPTPLLENSKPSPTFPKATSCKLIIKNKIIIKEATVSPFENDTFDCFSNCHGQGHDTDYFYAHIS